MVFWRGSIGVDILWFFVSFEVVGFMCLGVLGCWVVGVGFNGG